MLVSNQIRVVAFNVPQLTQASFLQKNQMLQSFFDISNTEIAVLPKIKRHFSNKSILKLKLSKNVFFKKRGP